MTEDGDGEGDYFCRCAPSKRVLLPDDQSRIESINHRPKPKQEDFMGFSPKNTSTRLTTT